jgi:hypothetical protein
LIFHCFFPFLANLSTGLPVDVLIFFHLVHGLRRQTLLVDCLGVAGDLSQAGVAGDRRYLVYGATGLRAERLGASSHICHFPHKNLPPAKPRTLTGLQQAPRVYTTISLAFLAPYLVKAAVEGRLPHGIGVARDAPVAWSHQHEMLGFVQLRPERRGLCAHNRWFAGSGARRPVRIRHIAVRILSAQPATAVSCLRFRVLTEGRQFRRLAAMIPVSGVEFWRIRAEGRESRWRVSPQ